MVPSLAAIPICDTDSQPSVPSTAKVSVFLPAHPCLEHLPRHPQLAFYLDCLSLSLWLFTLGTRAGLFSPETLHVLPLRLPRGATLSHFPYTQGQTLQRHGHAPRRHFEKHSNPRSCPRPRHTWFCPCGFFHDLSVLPQSADLGKALELHRGLGRVWASDRRPVLLH